MPEIESDKPGSGELLDNDFKVTFKCRMTEGSLIGEYRRFATFIDAPDEATAIEAARARMNELYGERRYIFVAAVNQTLASKVGA